MELVTTMTLHLMDVFGVKEQTARGYAVVIAALRFIYDRNEEFFLDRGNPWAEFIEVYVTIVKGTSYYTQKLLHEGPHITQKLIA